MSVTFNALLSGPKFSPDSVRFFIYLAYEVICGVIGKASRLIHVQLSIRVHNEMDIRQMDGAYEAMQLLTGNPFNW
jgi:hypothetical protein